ncbi:MAG: ribonuclease R [Acidobacteria bacterium]|nr:ribonuclease R [Acidobacteriota bacterium]
MSRRHQISVANAVIDLESVLEELRQSPEGLSPHDLGDLLELNRAEIKSLTGTLNRLASLGLLRRHGQEFVIAQQQRALIGVIRQRRRKTIHFIPDDAAVRKLGRMRVELEEVGGAFDGDRVIASVSRPNAQNERDARVEMIVKRGVLRIIGRLHFGLRGWRDAWVESLDEKFLHDIDLTTTEGKELNDGHIVIVEITSYPGFQRHPQGHIVEALGANSDEMGMDINIVIHKHDLPHIFPDEVLAEAKSYNETVSEADCAGRRDFRNVPTVTIDGETARDFDDAISLRKLDNGNFELGVHIADVSHYVRVGTALDHEARLRGTSVYFPERAIPMLPERLSNGICSLNPNVDRLTMTALMEVDARGRVVNYELCESVIRSAERMTYTNVNKVLQGEDEALTARYAPQLGLFKKMEELARILIKMRNERGAIDFNLPEAVFNFDDEGRIAGIHKADRNIAHRLIEEFMLLANETVAGHFARLAMPAVYRIHEDPDPQRVIEFAELAHSFGYGFPFSEVTSHDYQVLSQELSGKPEEKVLAYAMLRSLQRARYAASIKGDAGHFGLASATYTHFTSPIRRYPDLLVHRTLRGMLKRGAQTSATVSFKGQPPLAFADLQVMAEESSERERAADAAEHEIDDWRKAKFMNERIGEEYDGTIINVKDFGFYVELDDVFIEGLVAVQTLIDDFYRYDERIHALVGRAGKRFHLGDRVRVRVDKVNVDRHLVDFSLIGHQGKARVMPSSKPAQHKPRYGKRKR